MSFVLSSPFAAPAGALSLRMVGAMIESARASVLDDLLAWQHEAWLWTRARPLRAGLFVLLGAAVVLVFLSAGRSYEARYRILLADAAAGGLDSRFLSSDAATAVLRAGIGRAGRELTAGVLDGTATLGDAAGIRVVVTPSRGATEVRMTATDADLLARQAPRLAQRLRAALAAHLRLPLTQAAAQAGQQFATLTQAADPDSRAARDDLAALRERLQVASAAIDRQLKVDAAQAGPRPLGVALPAAVPGAALLGGLAWWLVALLAAPPRRARV